jgi:hypothetical protein
MTDYWAEVEALEDERFEADMLMAEYEAEGRRAAAAGRRSRALAAAGDLEAAAAACPHGGGYPLASPAAEHEGDPRKGEDGFRCWDCGSVLSESPFGTDYTIVAACDWKRG